MSTPWLRPGRRAAVFAAIVAVELASAGFAIDLAAAGPGLTIVVTASVDGATSTWAPSPPIAALPAATVATDPAPVEESSSPNEPEPTTRSLQEENLHA